MKSKAFVLVFDGMADWELPHALCEINKSERFEVDSVGFSKQIVTTMGGLKLIPDITIDEVTLSNVGIFMLPGGDMWESETHEDLRGLLVRFHAEEIPIAGICGATLEIVRAGLTHNIRHTSNSRAYLKEMISDYVDDDFYTDALAVTDDNIITASGLGCVEFALEVIRKLNLYEETDAQSWYDLFKHGVYPGNTVTQ
jgi:putative intracellular protease/amidase